MCPKNKNYNINLSLAILCLKQATVGQVTIRSEREFHAIITQLPKNDRLYLKSDTKFTGFNSDIYHSAVTQPETQSALSKQQRVCG